MQKSLVGLVLVTIEKLLILHIVVKVGSNPIGTLQSMPQIPLLQSSEIPNLGLTAQIGNFWLTPWYCVFVKKRESQN